MVTIETDARVAGGVANKYFWLEWILKQRKFQNLTIVLQHYLFPCFKILIYQKKGLKKTLERRGGERRKK